MFELPTNVNIKKFKFKNTMFALDVPSTSTFIINELTAKVIDLINDYSSEDILKKLKINYSEEDILNSLEFINDLYNSGKITVVKNQVQNSNSYWDNNKYTLTLHSSRNCNLDCKYCFGDKDYISNKEISLSTAKDAIDFLVNDFGVDGNKFVIDLSGSGEPLLRFDFIKDIYNYCKKVSDNIGKEVLMSFVTNGTLLDKGKIEDLSSTDTDTDILYGISIDGSKKLNDNLRVYKDGQGVYDDIIENCKKIKNRDHLGFAVTVTGKHTNIKDVFLHLFNLDLANTISMKPVRGNSDSNYAINERNIDELKKGYSELASFLLDKTVKGKLDYIYTLLRGEDYFGKFIKRIFTKTKVNRRCDAGLSRLSVNHKGEFYMCPVEIDNEDFKIGNIYEGIDEEKYKKIRKISIDNNDYCNECWARYICGGECFSVAKSIHNELEKPYSIMCEYKKHLIKLSIYLVNNIRKETPDIYKKLYVFCMKDKMYNVSDPGSFCLNKIANYYNINDVSIRKIRDIANVNENGVSPLNLFKAAKEIGLEITGAKAEKEDLKKT